MMIATSIWDDRMEYPVRVLRELRSLIAELHMGPRSIGEANGTGRDQASFAEARVKELSQLLSDALAALVTTVEALKRQDPRSAGDAISEFERLARELAQILEELGPVTSPSREGKFSGEVLLVHPEEKTRVAIREMLVQEEAFIVFDYPDPMTALQEFSQVDLERIKLLLTEVGTEESDGTKLAHTLHGMNPSAKIIAYSGTSDESVIAPLRGKGAHWIEKPFNLVDLRELIHRIL